MLSALGNKKNAMKKNTIPNIRIATFLSGVKEYFGLVFNCYCFSSNIIPKSVLSVTFPLTTVAVLPE